MQLSKTNAIFLLVACIAPGVVGGALCICGLISPIGMFIAMGVGVILVPMLCPIIAPRVLNGACSIILREKGVHIQSRKCKASTTFTAMESLSLMVQEANKDCPVRVFNFSFAVGQHEFNVHQNAFDDAKLFDNTVDALRSAQDQWQEAIGTK